MREKVKGCVQGKRTLCLSQRACPKGRGVQCPRSNRSVVSIRYPCGILAERTIMGVEREPDFQVVTLIVVPGY